MNLNAPRGTEDLTGARLRLFNRVRDVSLSVAAAFNYNEVMTPLFEDYKLFERGVGEVTDVVMKEMFVFGDDGDDKYALRPEGTAPVARFILEHSLHKQAETLKYCYCGPYFRKERPQKGRFRQFHQIGAECVGADSPESDAEIVLFCESILAGLSIKDYRLVVNSIGCPACRGGYRDKLTAFFKEKAKAMCEDCKSRFDRNVFRLLDCKNEGCKERVQGAPSIESYLCGACRDFHERVLGLLDTGGVRYEKDPYLFRGFDYYTRTVMEWKCDRLGAQNQIASGGRYDNLLKDLGSVKLPGVGFAMGVERVMLLLDEKASGGGKAPRVYGVYVSDRQKSKVFALISRLRRNGISADMSLQTRSIKAQMRQADKSGSKWVCVIGEDEARENRVRIKEMSSGKEEVIDEDNILDRLA